MDEVEVGGEGVDFFERLVLEDTDFLDVSSGFANFDGFFCGDESFAGWNEIEADEVDSNFLAKFCVFDCSDSADF